MATVAELKVRAGRKVEAVLLGLAVAVAVLARSLVDYHAHVLVIADILWFATGAAAVAAALHVVVRRYARAADPVLIPAVVALNGVGLAMARRLDYAYALRGRETSFGDMQLLWTLIGMVALSLLLLALRDHRKLRRFTYTAGVLGLLAYMLPSVPGLGATINGAQIWIEVFGRTMQPGEFAKIALVVFCAGYLVTNRDTLALVGPRVLGMRFPRPRDMGPLLLVTLGALLIMVFQTDLGAALLFFGIFVALLYVATERTSWVVLGVGTFLAAAVFASTVFSHVGTRYDAWLNAMDAQMYSSGRSEQLVRGLFGMASGGLFGTGLGEGRPDLVPYAESDFIVASLGEELGLTGLMAILTLYVIIVQRAMRCAIGVRDGFGKLLAAGLGFAIALQVFIVVGGVTRLIPLTGLTTPFLAYGGSSIIANWLVVALLVRISDHARRPATEAL